MPEKTIQIASPPSRLFALILDFVLIMFFTRVALVPVFLPKNWDILSVVAVFVQLIPAYSIAIILFLCKDVFFAKSVGKYLCNIKVVSLDEDFSSTSFWRRIKRNLFLILLPLELYKLLKDDYCLRYGDIYSKTIVIKAASEIKLRMITSKFIFVVLILCALWSLYVYFAPKQIQQSAFYYQIVEAIKKDVSIIDQMGDLAGVKEIQNYEIIENKHQLTLEVTGSKKSGVIKADFEKKEADYLIQSMIFEKKIE